MRSDEEDPVVGQVAGPGGAPAAKAAPKNPLDEIVGNPSDLSTPLEWARALLGVTKQMGREESLNSLKAHADGMILNVGLNLGRKGLVKAIFLQGMAYGNADLEERKQSPITRVLGINCGSSGDFQRDNDITCYAGDDLREEAFFRGVTRAAGELGLKVKIAPGSIDIPELEVSIFRGGNDIPDARYARDVASHVKQYQKAIQKQRTSKEAYKGKAVMVELAGKISQGQAEIQELTWNAKAGEAEFDGHLPKTFREVRSILHGSATYRAERWELSSHMVSNTLSALRGTHGDPTKGALKYAGRSLKSLASFYGFNPWDRLTTDDRVRLLARVMTNFDVTVPNHRQTLEKMAETLDLGWEVLHKRETLTGKSAEEVLRAEQVAEIFLRRSVAATGSAMAMAMLDPPPFTGLDSLPVAERRQFEAMSPEKRFEYWSRKDEIFRWCTSYEAMEDLLMTMVELRQLDLELLPPDPKNPTASSGGTGGPAARQPGLDAMKLMIEQAPAKARPLLALATEYAEVYTASGHARTPEQCIEQLNKLYEIRGRMKQQLRKNTTPGTELTEKMAKVKPGAYLKNEAAGKPSLLGRPSAEINQRFMKHVREAFPSTADAYRRFKADLESMGKVNYAKRRLAEEICQMDTIADGLTLLEMYQRDADAMDYASFVTINVLSRFHWSIGHLIAAAQVGNVEALQALGKNVFFATAARLVPSAGQMKVLFDVAQGTVTVTVGYVVRGENAELVDALYCGDRYLGPVDQPRIRKGTVANARREAGFSVLSPSHFVEVKDPGTGKTAAIALDRQAIYRDAMKRWTGTDYDALEDRGHAPAAAARLIKAHDDLVKLIVRQAESTGPMWVTKPRKDTPNFHIDPDENEFEASISALYPLLTEHCRLEAQKVLAEGAARTYVSWLDAKDVIEEELVRRYTADVFGGLMETWESRLTAQRLAKREIERAAMQADLAEIAKHLAETAFAFPIKKPKPKVEVRVTPRGVKPELELFNDYDLDAVAEGLGLAGETLAKLLIGVEEGLAPELPRILDGALPIAYAPILEGVGDASDADEVVVEMEQEEFTVVARTDGKEDDGTIGPGDLVLSETTFVAKDEEGSGEILSRETVAVLIRMPDAPSDGKYPIRHAERELGMDGDWFGEFDYIDIPMDDDLPPGWKREDSTRSVLHGTCVETYLDDGEISHFDLCEYRFGKRHGVRQVALADRTVVLQEHYEQDLRHGQAACVESPFHDATVPEGGQCRATFERGHPTQEEVFAQDGRCVQRITFRLLEDRFPRESYYAGTIERWFEDGTPWQSGAYLQGEGLPTSGDTDYGGLGFRRFYYTKTGVWTTWHENGKVESKVQYERDERNGAAEYYAENGTLVARGQTRMDKATGKWEFWHANGLLLAVGTFQEGRKTGTWKVYGDTEDDREPFEFDNEEDLDDYLHRRRWWLSE